jgi:hypothetical protein
MIRINAYDTFIVSGLLLYIYLIYQLDKKGFIATHLYAVIISVNSGLLLIKQIDLLSLIQMISSILCAIIFMHGFLPIRPRVRKLYHRIDKNKPLTIYHNRIEQDNVIIDQEFDFRQSEMDWLCYKVLLMSHTLTQLKEVYRDDELFSHHIQMNIV